MKVIIWGLAQYIYNAEGMSACLQRPACLGKVITKEGFTMAMAWVWTAMVAISVVYGIFNGTISAVGAAALEGASTAVTLCISMAGVICLWSGVMEVMKRGGLSEKLARLLRPVLRRLFPGAAGNEAAMEAVSANVSANLLGLGNAATPLGIRAAGEMKRGDVANDDLCTLVVLNTASIQLIPATVAGVRAAAGALNPFSILPAVWITSVASVMAGLLAARLLRRVWGS